MALLFSYLRRYTRLVLLALVLAAVNQVFSLLDPLIFTPDGAYYKLGERVARAWDAGKVLKRELRETAQALEVEHGHK